MIKKLRSRRGVTMAEMLVALAMLALMTAAVILGIGAAGRVRRDAVKTAHSQILLSTLSQAVSDELRFATRIAVGADGTFSYASANYGENAKLTADENGHLAVQQGTQPPKPLVGSGSYGAEYTAAIAAIYVPAEDGFSVTLTIFADGATLREQTYYVRALNPPA